MSSQSLRVPKQVVEVEYLDSHGNEGVASVYLADAAVPGERPERLQDLLTNRRFVPLRGDEGFSFLSRDHIVWIRLDLLAAIDELDAEAEGSASSVSAGIKVRFEDGTILRGGIRYLRPKASRRVGDYLEGLPRFFPLRTPQKLFLINRDRVVEFVPIHEVA